MGLRSVCLSQLGQPSIQFIGPTEARSGHGSIRRQRKGRKQAFKSRFDLQQFTKTNMNY
jgi:hypothetical protein